MDDTSVDSIQLLRMDLEVDDNCVHNKEYPLSDTNIHENILKMADTKIVRRFVATSHIIKQTVQNPRTVQTVEQPQRVIQTQQILQSTREPGAVKSFLLPKTTSIRQISGQNIHGKIVPHPNDPNKRILINPMLPLKNLGKFIKYFPFK